MNSSFLNDFNRVDLNQNWVDVQATPDQGLALVVEKKSFWKKLLYGFVYVITFAAYDREKRGLEHVAYAINQLSQTLHSGKAECLNVKLAERSIKKLSPFEKANPKIESSLRAFRQQISASAMYQATEDPQKIIEKFLEYQAKDPAQAEAFFLAGDYQGRTFFHHFMGMQQNIQLNTLNSLYQVLGRELVKKCLLKQDANGESPLDIAIAHGQMAVISRAFPIPPNEGALTLNESEKKQIEIGLKEIIKTLSNPDERALLLCCCPGEVNMNYDKLNHIISALHALVCYDFKLSPILNSLSGEEKKNLPYGILFLCDGDYINTFKSLSEECLSLTTSEEVGKKLDEWQIEPQKIETTSYIPLNRALQKDAENPLMGLIRGALFSDKKADKIAFQNHLAILLNPFEAYDQKIDFSNSKYSNILQQVSEEALLSPALDIELEVGPLISKLVMKHPDFLRNVNRNGQTVKGYLDAKEQTPRVKALIKVIRNLEESHRQILFDNLTKKTLKFYLENKGSQLKMKGL